MPRIDILLATYNGANYLPAQLSSLGAQTHSDWRLIVRDDGSRDGSLDIVRKWAEDEQRQLLVVEDGETRLGAAQSFGRLLERSDAPYFAFCDQDDFWKDTKIEKLLDAMQALETDVGKDKPLVVHCDLEIVDANLDPTGKLFWNESRLVFPNPDADRSDTPARSNLLLQNVVTGCAMLGNSELRQRATPLPSDAYVHDWWVALIAGYLGAVVALPEPLVKYRQHGANTIGAKSWDMVSMLRRFASSPSGTVKRTIRVLKKSQLQARCFHQAFGDSLSGFDREVVLEYSNLSKQAFVNRKTFMFRHSVYPKSWLRRIVLFCLI
jgi:glycosyltransferase involved in cell wall biosynthesis